MTEPTDGTRVRPERPGDAAAIGRLHEAAFGRPDEAALVERLRAAHAAAVSLVAAAPGGLVGHVLFSPAEVPAARAPVVGLAPLAVAPDRQRTGIGSALVRAGLAACRAAGVGAIVVLGDPGYYPRFGFAPASGFGLSCAWDAPPGAFMALELRRGCLGGGPRLVRYHDAFDAL